MPLVKPFRLDVWIKQHKPQSTITLHDSLVTPLSLRKLVSLAGGEINDLLPLDAPLSYGPIHGSQQVRASIASLYGPDACTENDVLTTTGAILANFLILDTLLSPGDHVVVQYPTYGQLYEIPKRSGAEVSLWRMEQDQGWTLDCDELEKLIRPGQTKMIILNNPSNPTGSTLSTELLHSVAKVAVKHGILILCDEVFRPMFNESLTPPVSALSLGYENVIITGSMSKAFGLAGIRLGWIAVHPSLRDTTLKRLAEARDYTSIAVSQLDDHVAAYALQPKVRQVLLERSLAPRRQNLQLLHLFIDRYSKNVSWVPPTGAGTCVIRITDANGDPVDDRAFAEALVAERGLLIPPAGYCFGGEGEGDLRGYLRIATAIDPQILEKGLQILGGYLTEKLK